METTKIFVKEEIIFQQGERSKYAYIIESGKVGIYKEHKYAKRSLVGMLKKSDLFGEMWLLPDKKSDGDIDFKSSDTYEHASPETSDPEIS